MSGFTFKTMMSGLVCGPIFKETMGMLKNAANAAKEQCEKETRMSINLSECLPYNICGNNNARYGWIRVQVVPVKVVYNDPATVVYWSDGTKTIVKCHDDDVFDEREGFLLCCAKKLMGNTGVYNDLMREVTSDQHCSKFSLSQIGAGIS